MPFKTYKFLSWMRTFRRHLTVTLYFKSGNTVKFKVPKTEDALIYEKHADGGFSKVSHIDFLPMLTFDVRELEAIVAR